MTDRLVTRSMYREAYGIGAVSVVHQQYPYAEVVNYTGRYLAAHHAVAAPLDRLS
jgi:hypothetical protein